MSDASPSRSTRATPEQGGHSRPTRYVVLAVAVAVLFIAAYSFVASRSGGLAPDTTTGLVEASTTRSGGVQEISVDVSRGYFDPGLIKAEVGVPLRVSFGRGTGCMARVRFDEFGIDRDLTAGGAVVDLPALEKGEYQFSCGMAMVFGKLVVE